MKKRKNIIEQIALDMSCTPALMPDKCDVVPDKVILQKIQHLTDWEQSDRDGRALLLNAAFYGRQVIAEHLLDRGCNVNAQDHNGFTSMRQPSQGTQKWFDCFCAGVRMSVLQIHSEIRLFCVYAPLPLPN